VAGAGVGKDRGELGDALTSVGERQEAGRRRTSAATDGHGGRRIGFVGGAGSARLGIEAEAARALRAARPRPL
jgi:hypothetical protein